MAVVHGGELSMASRCHLLVNALGARCGDAVPACGDLSCRRPCVDSAMPTVEADARATVDHGPSNDGSIERVVNNGAVHVYDRGVVVKRAARPEAAGETGAKVTEAVVNSAVETDAR